MEKDFKTILRKTLNIIKTAIQILAMIAFFVIPFLNGILNSVIAQIIWYPSCFAFFIESVRFIKREEIISKIKWVNHISKKTLLPCIVLLGSVFVINYYTTSYTWWWAAFMFIAISAPSFVLGVKSYVIERESYTEDEIKNKQDWYYKLIVFYWILDLLYMSIFKYWQSTNNNQSIWLWLQFVFGMTAIVVVFYNLVQTFLKSNDKNMFLLIQDFILGLAITVYLIYLVPDRTLQEIIFTIVGAVFGGLITLVGVAWTIKDNSKKLKEERKLSIRPYLESNSYAYKDISDLPIEDTTYITLQKQSLIYNGDIPKEVKQLIITKRKIDKGEKVDPIDEVLFNDKMGDFFKKKYLLEYKIFNHGAGNAINVQMKINEWRLKPFCISTTTPKCFLIIINEDLIEENKKSYSVKISFIYTDIASMGKYMQTEEFALHKGEHELMTGQLEEFLLTAPKEIED